MSLCLRSLVRLRPRLRLLLRLRSRSLPAFRSVRLRLRLLLWLRRRLSPASRLVRLRLRLRLRLEECPCLVLCFLAGGSPHGEESDSGCEAGGGVGHEWFEASWNAALRIFFLIMLSLFSWHTASFSTNLKTSTLNLSKETLHSSAIPFHLVECRRMVLSFLMMLLLHPL